MRRKGLYRIGALIMVATLVASVMPSMMPTVNAADAGAMFLENDNNPYAGALQDKGATTERILDQNLNSIGYDLGQVQKVNYVELTDTDTLSKLHEDNLSLYVSADNVTYTRIKDWDLFQSGKKLFLANFEAEARYVKVHNHYETDEDAGFKGAQNAMITAGYSEQFAGAGGGTFSLIQTATYEITGAGGTDKVIYVAKADASALKASLKSDWSDIRFVWNGKLLHHYDAGNGIYVRVPETTKGAKLTVQIYGKNASALNLSNMEGVFEALYGNKTIWSNEYIGFGTSARPIVRQMPNGDLIAMCENTAGDFTLVRSADGGHTWGPQEVVLEAVPDRKWYSGGFLEDGNKVWCILINWAGWVGLDSTQSDSKVTLTYTTDNGHTWSEPVDVEGNNYYSLNYGNGIKLSGADGAGANVDYVIPYTYQYGNAGALASSGIYSKDGGETWQSSKSDILFAGSVEAHEGGPTEANVTELSNGDLLMLMRNQTEGATSFCYSISKDSGVTWDGQAKSSTDLAAPNTQPVLFKNDNHHVLLWAGNNLFGGTSYYRMPLSLAYSTDDMQTWEQKLNLFLGTSKYGVSNRDNDNTTNPDMAPVTYNGSDDAYITFGSGQRWGMLLEDFEDYLYKTKGAADDFEQTSAKYAGWTARNGVVEVSSTQKKAGTQSLLINDEDGFVRADRTIPAMKNGEISFDIYLEKLNEPIVLDFKSALSDTHAEGAPIVLMIYKSGKIVSRDSSKAIGQGDTQIGTLTDLVGKWMNFKISFNIETKKAEFFCDGKKIGDLSVNAAAGRTITNVQITDNSSGKNRIVAYVDNFIAYEGAQTVKSGSTTTNPSKPVVKVTKPKATTIKKLVGGKKKITVKFKKISGIKGYELQVALKKNMKKGKKTYTVKASARKYVAKKLKGGKKYFVRMRTYKLSNGQKLYSDWTKIKTVKTKK